MSTSMREHLEDEERRLAARKTAFARYPDLTYDRVPGHEPHVLVSKMATADCDCLDAVVQGDKVHFLAYLVIDECCAVFAEVNRQSGWTILERLRKEQPECHAVLLELVKRGI